MAHSHRKLVLPKAPRRYAQPAGFRRQYPSAKAFLATQDRKVTA